MSKIYMFKIYSEIIVAKSHSLYCHSIAYRNYGGKCIFDAAKRSDHFTF